MGFPQRLRGLAEDTTRGALAQLRASLSAHSTSEGVLLGASAWLIAARRA